MIDYGKFHLPRSGRKYEVSLDNIAAYGMLKGLGLPEFADGQESVTVAAKSQKGALSEAMNRYGIQGASLAELTAGLGGADMATFVTDLGANPPQRKKMLRFLANYCAAFACDANEGPEYRRKFCEFKSILEKRFNGDKQAIFADYAETAGILARAMKEHGYELKERQEDTGGL